MSFKPFQFVYTPPPTVPEPNRSQVTSVPAGQQSISGTGTQTASPEQLANSLAGQLMNTLDDLVETSNYLQDAILNQTGKMGVEVDPRSDPEMGRALSRIYSSPEPPPIVAMSMYDKLLDADLGVTKVDMQAGSKSPTKSSPFQSSDLALATKRIETHLVQSGLYKSQLPVMLRALKGDTLIFQQWKQSLSKYPVIRSGKANQSAVSSTAQARNLFTGSPGSILQLATLDIDPLSHGILDGIAQRFAGLYAGAYSMLGGINEVEQDIGKVVNTYFFEPIANVVRIVAMFNGLRSLAHVPRLQDLADDLSNFAYARLAAEVGDFFTLGDRLVQIAIAPFDTYTSAIGSLVSQIESVSNGVVHTVGGLKGMLKSDPCSQGNQPFTSPDSKSLPISELEAIPAGLQSLASHMQWARDEIARGQQAVTSNLQRVMGRRAKSQGDRIDLMCSLNCLNSLVSLAESFINSSRGNTNTALSSQAKSPVGPRTNKAEVVGKILSNLKTGSGATISVQGSEVTIAPPTMPVVTAGVGRILTRGGLTHFSSPTRLIAQEL